jgi:hypothetical protein
MNAAAGTHGEDGARHGVAAPRGLAASASSRTGRFTRLFPHLPRCGAGVEAIEVLADRLDPALGTPSRPNDNIPAGYTYLSQFIDHDLTFDATSKIDSDNDPSALVNFRTPRFDLDSLYGSGPADQSFLYDWSDPHPGVRLLVGHNPPDGHWAAMDLPRNEQERAIIGDGRNDEHLIISQLHLLFIRFHNRVVDELHHRDMTLIGNPLFDAAHRTVRWHYQWIVLHDHLRRILGEELWTSLRPRFSEVAPDHASCAWHVATIPIEFSGAVYRFGHSMVRPDYPINPAHNPPAVPILAPGVGSDEEHLGGFRRLPAGLEIDWSPFFAPLHGVPSLRLDHRLAQPLFALPPDGASLARLNLRRGVALGLPSGSDIARAMGESPLTEDELFPPLDEASHSPPFWPSDFEPEARAEVLHAPPLWFYILREAAKRGDSGRSLGPVGGRIVAEVLIGLLEADPSSYLHASPVWKPTLKDSPRRTPDEELFTMSDLIEFTLREA